MKLRILYVASGIPVPGTLGGSTHVYEVARGLAQRGHMLHVVAGTPGWHGMAPFVRPLSSRCNGFYLHQHNVPKAMTLLGAWPILRLARAVRPHVVIERYYNFAGAGVWAARRMGTPCLLEVNALIVDPPAVFKRRLDDALGAATLRSRGPMRRWAMQQCRWASRIVTPLHTTVPPEIPRSKIVELPWGANVERFMPSGQDCAASLVPTPTALFLGSFRAWHGAIDFVRAATLLLAGGHNYRFMLIGDGPERAPAERLAAAWPGRFEFTGSVPYDQVPGYLQQASVGVAPFITQAHPALRAAGFFWSPLKIYEYMAAGLPVVTVDLPPLNTIIRAGQEGTLYPEGDLPALAAAIAHMLDNPSQARAMGARARTRVVEHYSWQRHCEQLELILETMTREHRQPANTDLRRSAP
jgi:glycosyltransferase involved in cell wall biosynthesis